MIHPHVGSLEISHISITIPPSSLNLTKDLAEHPFLDADVYDRLVYIAKTAQDIELAIPLDHLYGIRHTGINILGRHGHIAAIVVPPIEKDLRDGLSLRRNLTIGSDFDSRQVR